MHYLLLPLIPAFLIYFFAFAKDHRKFPVVLISFSCFLLGLSFFLYLPLKSKANPPIDWGNPETLKAFLAVVQRKQFSPFDQMIFGVSFPFKRSPSILAFFKRCFSSTLAYLDILTKEFSIFGLLLGFLGLYFCFRKEWKTGLLLFLAFLFSGCGFAFAVAATKPRVPKDFVSYLPSFLYFSCFLSFGLRATLDFLAKKLPALKQFFFFLAALLPLFLFFKNFKSNDFSQNKIALYHAQNILKTAGENSIIFAEENNWIFPLLYLITVEEKGRDVVVYDRNGNLFEDTYQQAKRSLIEEVWEKEREKIEEEIIKKTQRKVFYAVDKRFENYGYKDIIQAGILYQRKGRPVRIDFANEYRNILSLKKASFYDEEAFYIIAHYHLQFAEELIRKGKREEVLEQLEKAYNFGKFNPPLLNNLAAVYGKLGDIERAIELYEEIIATFPRYLIAHQNLGTLYQKKGLLKEAEREYKKALEIRPNFIPSLLSLGNLMARTGRLKEALEYYQRVLMVDPSNQNALRALEILEKK